MSVRPKGPPRSKKDLGSGGPIRQRLTTEERMQNANLSQEISRLYEELSDHILARDGEGASRIYQKLLHAGQSLEVLVARVTAIQNTPELELFAQAEEQSSRIPNGPPQGSAEPGFARGSIIERAVQRLD